MGSPKSRPNVKKIATTTSSPRLAGPKNSSHLLAFPPYVSYSARSHSIDEFISLTTISYVLAQQLLFASPREKLSDFDLRPPGPAHRSFSMADREITSVQVDALWLPYEAYAERENVDVDEIRRRAETGELGPIMLRPSDETPIILWPPQSQRPQDFQAHNSARLLCCWISPVVCSRFSSYGHHRMHLRASGTRWTDLVYRSFASC